MKLSRRDILRAGSLAAVGGLSMGCPLQRPPQTAAVAPVPELPAGGRAGWGDGVRDGLARVNVAADREIRTVVGLRPFRASGFRVEVERLDDKLLVHNYGHGGGGITLSWGTAEIAVEEALSAASAAGLSSGWDGTPSSVAPAANGPGGGSCAVVGCGVVGLSTAILMQRKGWQVTIYAKDVPPHTTSNIAGGFWSPHAVSDPGRTGPGYYDRFVRASRVAHRYFQGMVSDHYGVRWIDTYAASSAPQPQPWFEAGTEDLYPQARSVASDEHPFPRAHVRMYSTLLIEPYTYLEALMRDFRIASGQLVVRTFSDAHELAALNEPLVFNCTGMGAKELVNDADMDPIRGQLTFLLPQPEVDYCLLSGDLYMFPRRDGILLGGTHERGSWSTDPDAVAKQRILQGHADLFATTSAGGSVGARSLGR